MLSVVAYCFNAFNLSISHRTNDDVTSLMIAYFMMFLTNFSFERKTINLSPQNFPRPLFHVIIILTDDR